MVGRTDGSLGEKKIIIDKLFFLNIFELYDKWICDYNIRINIFYKILKYYITW